MPTLHIALLRGINVGRAKRVAMADLRATAEGLGYTEVRTLLNSGNLVFGAETAPDHGERLEAAFATQLGLKSRITVLTAGELARLIADNPFVQEAAENPSRLLVSVFRTPDGSARLAPLTAQDWSPEQLILTPRAAYSWHPDGISSGQLAEAIDGAGKDAVTARNWATLQKLQAAAPPA